jgi:methylenetetrahydrofolate dehydrogenase (NADP+)/methenyltetrahydrofolate cyclohydrolase
MAATEIKQPFRADADNQATVLIDGRSTARRLRAAIGRRVVELRDNHSLSPGLAVIMVGEDAASQVYVRNKAQQARETGMGSFEYRLPANVAQATLLSLIARLNEDPAVHGILVQLPLSPHVDTEAVIQAISPAKDVDGFHAINAGMLSIGADGIVPCTALGCVMLIKDQLDRLDGLHAVVIGRSKIVGKPVAALLLRENCTVTVAHSRTRDLPGFCRTADIVIAAVGRPKMVKGDWIKPGATVIDVGINRVAMDDERTRLVGDVDFDAACAVAGAITPVPGGVGPMTIACLLMNTLKAACHQHGLDLLPLSLDDNA